MQQIRYAQYLPFPLENARHDVGANCSRVQVLYAGAAVTEVQAASKTASAAPAAVTRHGAKTPTRSASSTTVVARGATAARIARKRGEMNAQLKRRLQKRAMDI